jgi:putative Mn2+ efflux pump MntP
VSRVLTVIGLVLPLGLDTFALSAALGVAGLTARERLRTSLILSGFEAGMPLIGFFAGSGIGTLVGRVSDYAAGGVLIAIGLYMLRPGEEEDEAQRMLMLQRARGAAILGLGLGVSVDELAIGFGDGLLRLPLPLLVVLIGAQAFVAAQIGLRLGARLGEDAREWAERLAGVLLVVAGILVIVVRIAGG